MAAAAAVRLTVVTGSSRLLLPVRIRNDTEAHVVFAAPEGAPPPTNRQLAPPDHNWRVIRDLASDVSTLEVINDDGTVYLEPIDLEMRRKALEWYSYRDDAFSSPRGETLWERGLRRGEWGMSTVTRTVLRSTPEHFLLHAQLDAYEGERRVYSRNWDRRIARDWVCRAR